MRGGSGVKPTITVTRPTITPEEREARMAEIRRAVAEFSLARARQTAQRKEGEQA